jgi:alpha-L-fucosidase 2
MTAIKTKIILSICLLLAFKKPFAQNKQMVLWDNRPAQTWMTEAYPLGNGRIGGMVFGGVPQEHIQFNEISLWTGDEQETGAYQAFGDLYVSFPNATNTPSNYRRQLDLGNAMQEITYTDNGINYKRHYFCSFPDQVMVLHYSANKKAAHSAVIQLADAHQPQTTADGARVKIQGELPNGLKYQATALVMNEGGSCMVEPDGKNGYQLRVKNADAFTILLSAVTNYSNQRKNQWRGQNPSIKVNQILAAASAKTYPQLMASHLKDYNSLFGRVSLSLGQTHTEIVQSSTHDRLINYKKKQDPELEALLFQYGRYLLISSSRKGGLPANLQGLWNESNNPPWRSDYHSNINIQMNYWLT